MPPFSIESLELASKTATSYDDGHIGSTQGTLPLSRPEVGRYQNAGSGMALNLITLIVQRAESRLQHAHMYVSVFRYMVGNHPRIHSLLNPYRKTSSIEYFYQRSTRIYMNHTERVTLMEKPL